tara:strand:- start:564 stop:1217 length:654 start_codon:yes stop_codon:yes gene_type:complete
MNKLINILSIFSFIPLLACSNSKDISIEIDSTSYINDFELRQENIQNDSLIIIKSPQALIDINNNDVEIFNSLIKIKNKFGTNIQINSGNSTFSNNSNLIKLYNNVEISLLDYQNSFIKTESFDWDLNQSKIILNNPLNIQFNNTQINSSKGLFNLDSNFLIINDNILNRNILDSKGKEKYIIEIHSDIAKWYKDENQIQFISEKEQVETNIYFLRN